MKAEPSTTYAILGALMPGPSHGHEILQFLEKGLGPRLFVWKTTSQVLPIVTLARWALNARAMYSIPTPRPGSMPLASGFS